MSKKIKLELPGCICWPFVDGYHDYGHPCPAEALQCVRSQPRRLRSPLRHYLLSHHSCTGSILCLPLYLCLYLSFYLSLYLSLYLSSCSTSPFSVPPPIHPYTGLNCSFAQVLFWRPLVDFHFLRSDQECDLNVNWTKSNRCFENLYCVFLWRENHPTTIPLCYKW